MQKKFHFSDASARSTIPFELARNGLFFQVRVNGSAPLWFTLDSGAGTNYLDLGIAREIGPLKSDRHLHYVRARITVPGNPSEESLFLVDTGSQDEVDHPIIAKSPQTRRTTVGVGFGRPSVGVFGPVETLQLGKFQLHDLSGVAGEGLGSHLIGGGILHRFKIIFDYSRQRMILEPARKYGHTQNGS